MRVEHVAPSEHIAPCAGKGTASYLDVVGQERKENAAWYYPNTKPRAEHIRGHVACRTSISVVE